MTYYTLIIFCNSLSLLLKKISIVRKGSHTPQGFPTGVPNMGGGGSSKFDGGGGLIKTWGSMGGA